MPSSTLISSGSGPRHYTLQHRHDTQISGQHDTATRYDHHSVPAVTNTMSTIRHDHHFVPIFAATMRIRYDHHSVPVDTDNILWADLRSARQYKQRPPFHACYTDLATQITAAVPCCYTDLATQITAAVPCCYTDLATYITAAVPCLLHR